MDIMVEMAYLDINGVSGSFKEFHGVSNSFKKFQSCLPNRIHLKQVVMEQKGTIWNHMKQYKPWFQGIKSLLWKLIKMQENEIQ